MMRLMDSFVTTSLFCDPHLFAQQQQETWVRMYRNLTMAESVSEKFINDPCSVEKPNGIPQSDVVKLDVGGSKFTTTLSTLQNVPDTMLAAMFSGRHNTAPNAEGYYFIDRDGTHFRHILNYLRSPMDFEIGLSKSDMIEFEREVRFYCLVDAFEHSKQSSATSEWEITATSAGYNVHRSDPPSYRSYFTSGKHTTKNGSRGWNIVLLHPRTCDIISQKCFDLYGDRSDAVRQCVQFLRDVPAHTLLLLAVFDDGATHATPELFSLLKEFGGSGRTLEFRASYALIGRKGMQAGQAVEAYSAQGNVVTVSLKM